MGGEAFQVVEHVFKILGSWVHDGKTLYELQIGEKPFFDHLWIFKTPTYVHIPKELINKLDPKNFKVVFIGYYTHWKVYIAFGIENIGFQSSLMEICSLTNILYQLTKWHIK